MAEPEMNDDFVLSRDEFRAVLDSARRPGQDFDYVSDRPVLVENHLPDFNPLARIGRELVNLTLQANRGVIKGLANLVGIPTEGL